MFALVVICLTTTLITVSCIALTGPAIHNVVVSGTEGRFPIAELRQVT